MLISDNLLSEKDIYVMKIMICLFIIALMFAGATFLLNGYAQNNDYTKWELPEGAKVRLGKGAINDIACSPDGSQIAVASRIGIWIYDAHTGKELDLLTWQRPVEFYSVCFSTDGRSLAGGAWGDVVLWDATTRKHLQTLTGHTNAVSSLS